jgi:hypothetical protein
VASWFNFSLFSYWLIFIFKLKNRIVWVFFDNVTAYWRCFCHCNISVGVTLFGLKAATKSVTVTVVSETYLYLLLLFYDLALSRSLFTLFPASAPSIFYC